MTTIATKSKRTKIDMIRITAKYKGASDKFFYGSGYILYPAYNMWNEIFIHDVKRRTVIYKSLEEFKKEWIDVRAYDGCVLGEAFIKQLNES